MAPSLGGRLLNISNRATSFSHDEIRQEFIRALCDFVRETTDAEPEPRLEERLLKGRTDARLGGIVFEVKRPNESIEEAMVQVRRYLEDYREKGFPVRGVAYNGIEIGFLDEEGKEVWRGEVLQGASLLEGWLLLLSLRILDPERLVILLGFPSEVTQSFIAELYRCFIECEDIAFVKEAFEVWRAIYGAAANLNKETLQTLSERAKRLEMSIKINTPKDALPFLFVLQTYLAILLRLFVARLAVQRMLVPHLTLRDLLSPPGGEQLYQLRRLNSLIPALAPVFEEDPFLWFCEAAEVRPDFAPSLNAHLSNIVRILDDLDLVSTGHDFLRRFYHHFFDPPMRRALGEFYTSEELVNEVLDAVEFTGSIDEGPLLDPACGSGTFLVEAIKRTIKAYNSQQTRKTDLVQKIVRSIIGVDIHPLAVAMARTNYLLALGELLSDEVLRSVKRLPIPIYWTDSLSRLSRQAHLGGIEVCVPALGVFCLPDPHVADWDLILSNVRDILTNWRGPPDTEKAWRLLKNRLSQEITGRFEETLKAFLGEWLRRHVEEGRDSRWLPFLRNLLAIEKLRERCSFVVGNPPWVRIHNIESSLRERIFSDYVFCKDAGWQRAYKLAGVRAGFARQVDYWLPFIERGLELLKEGGRLGVVITSKVQQALYANILRKEISKRTRILKFIDQSLTI